MKQKPPIPSRARLGDVWLLGRHRLACGDAGDAAVLAAAMGGEQAEMLVTSPPYGDQRAYTTGGIGDWTALMQGVFRASAASLAPGAQVLVNLGLVHREGEWQPYWSAWLDWMRTIGWRRFGLYAWDQGPGLPGGWAGRLAPSFELVFHLNRASRMPNKIIPCRWAGHVQGAKGGLRARDGTVGGWTHAGRAVQSHRIPDSVIRITRHKARGIETAHPAVFPIGLPAFLMQSYSGEAGLVLDPFAGAGSTILAGEATGRRVVGIELAPAYVDVALARWDAAHPRQPARLAEGRQEPHYRGLISSSPTLPRPAAAGPLIE